MVCRESVWQRDGGGGSGVRNPPEAMAVGWVSFLGLTADMGLV